VVEGARLESVYGGNPIEGSNPSLSTKKNQTALVAVFLNETQDIQQFQHEVSQTGISPNLIYVCTLNIADTLPFLWYFLHKQAKRHAIIWQEMLTKHYQCYQYKEILISQKSPILL
jgi:hypothetical protein